MNTLPSHALRVVVVVCGWAIAGCGDTASTSSPSSPSGGEAPATAPAAGASTESDEIAESLAKLSPEDRALAEKQVICPVSDAKLGSMGPPQKVDVNGEAVWICCEGCKGELLEKSDKYLAKLKK